MQKLKTLRGLQTKMYVLSVHCDILPSESAIW